MPEYNAQTRRLDQGARERRALVRLVFGESLFEQRCIESSPVAKLLSEETPAPRGSCLPQCQRKMSSISIRARQQVIQGRFVLNQQLSRKPRQVVRRLHRRIPEMAGVIDSDRYEDGEQLGVREAIDEEIFQPRAMNDTSRSAALE